ncbi:uncharacterized protein [Oscarella lobularis]|uniref:uncharacterized protein n=1 Tax=Oscarella lobularis TaxID=121494 RepID=UPI003313896E
MQTETMESSTEVNKSDIPLTLPDVHWFPGMELGFGFDVLTGEVKPSPFKMAESKAEKVSSSSQSSEETFSFIESAQDIEKEMSVSTSLSFGLGSFSSSLSSEISDHVKVSQNTVTAIRKKTVKSDSYEMLDVLDLKEEAKSLLEQNDMIEFRNRYGDYFVAGMKRGSSFRAYYRCSASSSEEMSKLKASLKASYMAASAENETDVSDESKKINRCVSVSYTMYGVEGTYKSSVSTLEDVNKALDYFSSNDKGAPLVAILRHYAFLNLGLRAQVPLDPLGFQHVKEISHHVLELEQRLKSPLTLAVRKQIQAYLNEFTRFRHALATDAGASKRNDLLKEYEEISESLREVRRRSKFLSMVGSSDQPEAKEYGSWVRCGFHPENPGLHVSEQIKREIQSVTVDGCPKDHNTKTPLYFFDPEKCLWRNDEQRLGSSVVHGCGYSRSSARICNLWLLLIPKRSLSDGTLI